jgi:RimK family alpha-L-glutamate ligase
MELVSSLGGNKNIILQEFISHRSGQDLRVFVIGGQCIGVMLRKSVDGSFKANISRGGVGEPYELNSDVTYLALETAKILGLDIAGIDLLFDKNGYKICEANSNPGFKGLESALNINVAKKIIKYAEMRNGAK